MRRVKDQKDPSKKGRMPVGRLALLVATAAYCTLVLMGSSEALAGLPGLNDVQRLATRTVFILERNPGLGVAAIAVVYLLLRMLPKRGI